MASADASTVANVFGFFNNSVRMKQVLAVLARCASLKKMLPFVRSVVRALAIWDSVQLQASFQSCSQDTQQALSVAFPSSKDAAASAATAVVAAPAPASVSGSTSSSVSPELPSPISEAVEMGQPPVRDAYGTRPINAHVPPVYDPTASLGERSASLRALASSLQLAAPALSPVSLSDPLRVEAQQSTIQPLFASVCECLRTETTSTLRLLCCTVLRRAVRKFAAFVTPTGLEALIQSCMTSLLTCSREVRKLSPNACIAECGLSCSGCLWQEYHVVEWSLAESFKCLDPSVTIEVRFLFLFLCFKSVPVFLWHVSFAGCCCIV
jgi:hypothetical protein